MRRSETIRAAIPVETPDGNRNKRRVPQRTPKLAADLVEQLVEAYLEGDSVYELARRFGTHRETVAAHLRRAGIQRRGSGAQPDQVQAASVPVPRST